MLPLRATAMPQGRKITLTVTRLIRNRKKKKNNTLKPSLPLMHQQKRRKPSMKTRMKQPQRVRMRLTLKPMAERQTMKRKLADPR